MRPLLTIIAATAAVFVSGDYVPQDENAIVQGEGEDHIRTQDHFWRERRSHFERKWSPLRRRQSLRDLEPVLTTRSGEIRTRVRPLVPVEPEVRPDERANTCGRDFSGSCPPGQELVPMPNSEFCDADCTAEECCWTPPPNCKEDFDAGGCPEGEELIQYPFAEFCRGDGCTAEECCVPIFVPLKNCQDDFGTCPPGQELVLYPRTELCDGDCTAEECCWTRPPNCKEDFDAGGCPEGEELIQFPSTEFCRGDGCTAEECCVLIFVPLKNCQDDFGTCPPGQELVLYPRTELCDGDCTTEECCWTPLKNCQDDFGTCPPGQDLVPSPSLAFCDGDCTAEECCWTRPP